MADFPCPSCKGTGKAMLTGTRVDSNDNFVEKVKHEFKCRYCKGTGKLELAKPCSDFKPSDPACQCCRGKPCWEDDSCCRSDKAKCVAERRHAD